MNNTAQIQKAVKLVLQGKVIGYPTEGVYGLGCDPFNQAAVERILVIKQRSMDKGLILIASNLEQIQTLISADAQIYLHRISDSQSPCTWIFPKSASAPKWISGQHDSIAIRLTQHPISQALCTQIKTPLVSTSLNVSGDDAIRHYREIPLELKQKIDYVIEAPTGGLQQSTPIIDAITGNQLR